MNPAIHGEPYDEITDPSGRVYRTTRPQEYLTVDANDVLRLHMPAATIILNSGDCGYHHDGQGGLLLVGPVVITRVPEHVARDGFERLEHARERVAYLGPIATDWIDQCMASLLKALDQVDAWRARQVRAA